MKTNKLAIISFCLGIASYFLWELSIIPILAIILGVIAVVIILKNKEKGLWYGIIGIALGILGLLFRVYLGGVHEPLVSKPESETQTIPYTGVGLEKLPEEQAPAVATSLSKKESIKETCNSSSGEENLNKLNFMTIDESSLISKSNTITPITGYFPISSGNKRPTSVYIWEGEYDLSSVNLTDIYNKIVWRDFSDHGGNLWVCSSGRYLSDVNIPLKEGLYTVGVYHYDSIYTDKGYQGDTKSILLTSGILRVVK